MTAPNEAAALREARYTVVYEGDPYGAKILSGEAAPGRAVSVMKGDLLAERDAALAKLDEARAKEGRFWLELREPGRVPERKGSWPLDQAAKILREFMKARPKAYITVVTIGFYGPDFQDGPEALQMADARSMSTGARHIRSTRSAHDRAKQDAAQWPSGCLKPNSCGRHAACMYGSSAESCRHYGKDIAAEVEAAARSALTDGGTVSKPDRETLLALRERLVAATKLDPLTCAHAVALLFAPPGSFVSVGPITKEIRVCTGRGSYTGANVEWAAWPSWRDGLKDTPTETALILFGRVLPGWIIESLSDMATGQVGSLKLFGATVEITNGQVSAFGQAASRPLAILTAVVNAVMDREAAHA